MGRRQEPELPWKVQAPRARPDCRSLDDVKDAQEDAKEDAKEENVVKFIIQLHKCVYGYVTLFDVYECAINPDILAQRIAEGQALFEPG